jgi:nucleoid-associated protein YgaU
MNTYKEPEYRGYYLGKVAVALVLLIIVVAAAARNPGVTTAPAAVPATPVVQSAQLSPHGALRMSGASRPGSTVDLYAGDVRLGSVVAGPDGSWSYEGQLDPGDYQLVARTVDETGETVSESAAVPVTPAEAATGPVAEDSGTSAVATGAPEAAQVSATTAASAAGTAAAPMVESPMPLATAPATPATAAFATVAPETGVFATASPDAAQAPAAGEIATAASGAAQAPASSGLATAAPAPAKRATAGRPTTVVSTAATAGTAASSAGLAISRAVVDEAGKVTLVGTGRPNAPVEIVQGGRVIDRIVVKGDGTWKYSYLAAPGVQAVAVQYEGQPDSRSLTLRFESAGTPAAVPTSAVASQMNAGQAYIVQSGDYLRALAFRFYGDELQWPVIYDGTNAMAVRDASFAEIDDPNLIVAGWKIWIPAK